MGFPPQQQALLLPKSLLPKLARVPLERTLLLPKLALLQPSPKVLPAKFQSQRKVTEAIAQQSERTTKVDVKSVVAERRKVKHKPTTKPEHPERKVK